MDFSYSAKVEALRENLRDFVESWVIPSEAEYETQRAGLSDPHAQPPIMEKLRAEAQSRGLWNAFLLPNKSREGLTNLEFAPLAEIMGHSPVVATEACHCMPPDTGNIRILEEFGTAQQKERWLGPLISGEIRSSFSKTEPDVASSDSTNVTCTIVRSGDDYVINGRKWWSTGVGDPQCEVIFVMGESDPDAAPDRRQSVILVPLDTSGVKVVRDLSVYGYQDRVGHPEVHFEDVRVPASNLLAGPGDGFKIAYARLGSERMHYCMRAVGMAERALSLMCGRAKQRVAFGQPLSEQGVVRDWIAEARVRIEQTRLLVLRGAWGLDVLGVDGARVDIAAMKVAAAATATWVLDKAIQLHGGAGVSGDVPLAAMWVQARTLHLINGPDEVLKMSIAQWELND